MTMSIMSISCLFISRYFWLNFSIPNMLTQHIKSQKDGILKLYINFECNKSFPSKARLSVHSKVHTDYPRPFSCNFCEYKTHKTYNLTIHLETHNDQIYNCHLCEKNYYTQMSLKSHINYKHVKRIKNHNCGY